ncbi:reverse transcriptase domain-containing protein [Tanacetum coccineum]
MGGRGEGKDEVCSGGCVGAGGEWGVGECWVQGGVGRDGRVACWGGVKWSGVELGEVVRAWGGSLYGEGWGDGMSREGGCLKACGREDGGVLRRGRVDLGACVTLQWGGAVLWALREEGRVVRGTGGVMSRGLGEEAVEWRRSLGGEVGDDNETGPEGGGGGWVEVSCTGVRGAVFWCAGDGWWDVLVLRRVARWCSGGERLQISLLAGCGGGGTYRVGVGMKWVGEMAGGLGWTFGVGGWGGVWGTWVRVTGVLVVKCGGGGGGATGSWGEWERSGGGWGVGKFGVAEGEEGEKGGGWGGVADGGTVSVVEVESWVRGDECCVLWGVWVVKWGGGGEGGVADWRGGGGWAGRGWGCKGMRVRGRVGGGCGWGNGKGVGGDGRESGSGGVEGVGGWFEGEGGRAWDWAVGGDGGGRWEGEALGGVTEGAVDWGVEAVGVGRERWIGGESRVIQAVKLGVRAEGEGWGGGSAEEYLGCGLVGGGDVVGGGGDGGRGLGVGGWGVTYGVELVEVGAGEGGSVGWRWGRELRCGGEEGRGVGVWRRGVGDVTSRCVGGIAWGLMECGRLGVGGVGLVGTSQSRELVGGGWGGGGWVWVGGGSGGQGVRDSIRRGRGGWGELDVAGGGGGVDVRDMRGWRWVVVRRWGDGMLGVAGGREYGRCIGLGGRSWGGVGMAVLWVVLGAEGGLKGKGGGVVCCDRELDGWFGGRGAGGVEEGVEQGEGCVGGDHGSVVGGGVCGAVSWKSGWEGVDGSLGMGEVGDGGAGVGMLGEREVGCDGGGWGGVVVGERRGMEVGWGVGGGLGINCGGWLGHRWGIRALGERSFRPKYLTCKKDFKAKIASVGSPSFKSFRFKVIDTKGAENLCGSIIFPDKKIRSICSVAVVLQAKKLLTSSQLAIVDPPGDITVPTTPPKKFLTQDFIGPRFTEMPMTWSPDVTLVSVKEKFRNVMKCLKSPSKFAKSLTCGASISWGRSRLHEGTNTYSWLSTICQNGLKRKRSPSTTPELFVQCLNMESLTVSPPFTTNKWRQVEVSNHGLKRILERTVGENRASWSDKLDDALWAFRNGYPRKGQKSKPKRQNRARERKERKEKSKSKPSQKVKVNKVKSKSTPGSGFGKSIENQTRKPKPPSGPGCGHDQFFGGDDIFGLDGWPMVVHQQ